MKKTLSKFSIALVGLMTVTFALSHLLLVVVPWEIFSFYAYKFSYVYLLILITSSVITADGKIFKS